MAITCKRDEEIMLETMRKGTKDWDKKFFSKKRKRINEYEGLWFYPATSHVGVCHVILK